VPLLHSAYAKKFPAIGRQARFKLQGGKYEEDNCESDAYLTYNGNIKKKLFYQGR
jgi:hypothetical protein